MKKYILEVQARGEDKFYYDEILSHLNTEPFEGSLLDAILKADREVSRLLPLVGIEAFAECSIIAVEV